MKLVDISSLSCVYPYFMINNYIIKYLININRFECHWNYKSSKKNAINFVNNLIIPLNDFYHRW